MIGERPSHESDSAPRRAAGDGTRRAVTAGWRGRRDGRRRERVTSGLSLLRQSPNRSRGSAPDGYGFAAHREDLGENPAERAVVDRISAMRTADGSLRAIARVWMDAPIKTGARGSATVVRGLLVRESKLALAA